MTPTLLYPRWAAGLPVDVLPVRLRTGVVSKVGCWLVGHDFWTFGRTIHTRLKDAVLDTNRHAPVIRHELVHIDQQAGGKWGFLWKYLTRPSFRRQMEAEGHAAETAEWPKW